MPQAIHDEVKNALWGCLEIPLYLQKGTTRFSGTLSALKRSFIVPFLLIPVVIYSFPSPEIYEGQSFGWQFALIFIQVLIGTSAFAAVLYFFKAKHVTNDNILKCVTGYNWLTLSAYVVNIPLILLAVFGINTWEDVFAMMILTSLYTYSFLAFMIMYTLRVNIFIAGAFALTDLLMGEIIRNITTYFMLHSV